MKKKIEELKDEDQWALKEGVQENSECQREFSNPQVVPTTKKRNWGHAYCERQKHMRILGTSECIVKAKAQPPFTTLGFTGNINLAAQVKEGENTTFGYFNLRHWLK